MSLELYNTLSNKREEFVPIKKGKVKIYSCGPTVNDIPHLGSARNKISFDVLRRYLEFLEYDVTFVSNVTDIEDKIIAKAKLLGISVKKLTEKNLKTHLKNYSELNVKDPDVQPRATEHVPSMIDLIQRLEKKGYTYIVKEDGVYFRVSKFKDYGKLSGVNLEELQNKRELRDSNKGQEKEDNKDFVLWKLSKDGEPFWKSPWGKGRPGWHIECSAMSHEILGLPIDIHAGGQDLIFPHHEDEIAQAEAGYGKKFANYWVHNGMVNVKKVKMSKSLGNFKTIRELLKKFSGLEIRYFAVSNHYRKPIDFSDKKLIEAKTSLNRLKNLCKDLEDDGKIHSKSLKEFKKEMNVDLNTSGALNVLWKLLRDKNAEGKYGAVKKMDEVFGFKLLEKAELKIPKEVLTLAKKRENVRKKKNWARSDELRDDIKEKGFEVSDTNEGFELTKV
jgi:cysteinyl-tRNA synthetase